MNTKQLSGKQLSREYLSGEQLSGEQLFGEQLSGEHLSGEHLSGNNCLGNNCRENNCPRENLSGKQLSGETSVWGKLSGEPLFWEQLSREHLSGGHLEQLLVSTEQMSEVQLSELFRKTCGIKPYFPAMIIKIFSAETILFSYWTMNISILSYGSENQYPWLVIRVLFTYKVEALLRSVLNHHPRIFHLYYNRTVVASVRNTWLSHQFSRVWQRNSHPLVLRTTCVCHSGKSN